jgi:serine/threonine protein kinase
MLAMEAETTQPAQTGKRRSPVEWLDALAAGECDRETLFHGVLESVTADPDTGWELLALVDQYYRRQRIGAEDFQGLNAHLQALLVGGRSVKFPRPEVAPRAPARTANADAAPQPTALAARAPAPRRASLAAASRPAPAQAAARPAAPPAARAALQPAAAPAIAAPPTIAPAAMPVAAEPPATAAPPPADRARAPAQRTLLPDEVLRNRYRVQGVLGRGGMGTVYAAVDKYRLDQGDGGQLVALKVLHTDIIQRPQLLEELRNEFQRLQSLSHPNIVRVHEFDRDGDLTFFTMEHLSGAPLSRVLAGRDAVPLNRSHALSIIRQVGAAVAYAHSRGIVHGDLNPGNIFITDPGEVRLLDFGASHRLRPDPAIGEQDDPSRIAVVTPSYASCELLVGRPANTSDDVYAMACISYVLLTGKHPFQGKTALQAKTARMTFRRPSGIADRQWRALKAGLRSDRRHRPDDLQAWLDQMVPRADVPALPPLAAVMSAPEQRRSIAGWVTGILIAVVAALAWWALQNGELLERTVADLRASATSFLNGPRVDEDTPAAPESPARPSDETARSAPAATVATPPAVEPPAAPTQPPVVNPPAAARQPTAAADSAAAATPPLHRARLEMAVDAMEVAPMQTVASIVVDRRESYRSGVSFSWWTESGTAKPGRDFVPVKSRVAYVPSGERESRLLVPVVADPRRREARSFYVVIDEPGDGARLGSRTITMVTLPPSY